MFQGFQPSASDFFWELCFHNDRDWFHAHKEQFNDLIGLPLRELAKDSYDLLAQRFPEKPMKVHVSRIWRDARRLFGRGPLKENLWFSIERSDMDDGAASFFFELKPAVFSYGMGFWCPRTEQMDAFRSSVAANPAAFERLAASVAAMNGYTIDGPVFKRPKGDYGDIVNEWYNRKWTNVYHEEDFGGALLTAEMPHVLSDSFTELMPMYDYLSEHCRKMK